MKKKEIRRVIFTLFMAAVCIPGFYPVIMMVLGVLKGRRAAGERAAEPENQLRL